MKRINYMTCLCILVSLAAGPRRAAGAVHYVNDDAGGANNSASWTDAYTNLQSALAVAQSGDQIWVAEGVYTPAPPGDTVSSFVMREGVTLYGGFAGGETSATQRDWNAHPTILSGDVGQDDGTFNTWQVNAVSTPTADACACAAFDGAGIAVGIKSPRGPDEIRKYQPAPTPPSNCDGSQGCDHTHTAFEDDHL